MDVQRSKVYQKKCGTIGFNSKLVESYRDSITKKPRNRTVKKLESLPMLERARLIFEHEGSKYLRADEWQELSDADYLTHKQVDLKVGDVYSGAGSAVTHYNFRESGLLSILSDQLSNTTLKVVKELVLHQLVNSSSKSHFIKAGKSDINKQRETVSSSHESTGAIQPNGFLGD